MGYSSTIRCTFVPPTPNELTPALNGPSTSQLRGLAFTKNGLFSKSIVGFGFVKPSEAGISLLFNDKIVLINPATPAAAVR